MKRRTNLLLISALLAVGHHAAAQTVWVPGGTATGIGNNTTNSYVGVGTATPYYHFHVTSSHNPSTGIILENTATGGRMYGILTTQDGAGIGGGRLTFTDLTAVAHRMVITSAGNVGIGTIAPSHPLSVNGSIRAKEVIVDTGWSDYVFAADYRLAPLSEVEAHIREKRHLPGIPSAAEVAQQGISVGDIQSRLLAKIEELTLHQIAQEKRLNDQAGRISALEAENAALRSR